MRFLPWLFVGCSPLGPGLDPSADRDLRGRDAELVRVATWNIERVGAEGSPEHLDAIGVLHALDADVVLLQEIEGGVGEDRLQALAASAGYGWAALGVGDGFGSERNALLSRYPIGWVDGLDGSALSGDPSARDLTRPVLVARIESPTPLFVASAHLKSGNMANEQRFRRAVDGHRLAGAVTTALADFDPSRDAVVVGADFNATHGAWDGPSTWTSMPDGMPESYWLGNDLWGRLASGLPGGAFGPLEALGLDVLDARQPGGGRATRPESGRRLDHLAVSPAARPVDTGVFTCPGAWSTCTGAADHLPVWADLELGAPTGSGSAPGGLRLHELLPNPHACPDVDGEWIELHNPTDRPLDTAGLVLSDAAGNAVALDPLVVAPGGFALVGPGRCGPAVDLVASGVSLNNGGDSVFLSRDGVEVDALTYGVDAAAPERAWLRDGDRWCAGDPSPGAPNPACP